MRSNLLISLVVAVAGQASAGVPMTDPVQLAQNTGAVDRSLGNGSMGAGEEIRRLSEEGENDQDRPGQPARQEYEQSNHGDTDTDMEHRPRRTLGDQEQD
jgi:hypothetical protein